MCREKIPALVAVTSFEEQVKKVRDQYGFIDLFSVRDRQRAAVEHAAQGVLDVRAAFLAPGAPVSDPART